MNNELAMSFLTGLLVLVGIAQIMILINQKRQNQLTLLQEYRSRWNNSRKGWAALIFIGADPGEYYQVAEKDHLKKLQKLVSKYSPSSSSIWALEPVSSICNMLSDICIRIMQGQLDIRDVYPLFGSELLRQGKSFRTLLDVYYPTNYGFYESEQKHFQIRKELQDWLIYHDGMRRRCLILIDLLWAEAVRLDDLPPDDIKSGAEAKKRSGQACINRLVSETRRVNNYFSIFMIRKLSLHLRNAEYKKWYHNSGVCRKELEIKEKEWSRRLLREYDISNR